MLLARNSLLHILLLVSVATTSSLPTHTLPSQNLTLPASFPPANLTAPMNKVFCTSDPHLRPLSDFSTCIPSLFRLYATPDIHVPILWAPGDFKQWGPETDLGGCYVRVDGGGAMEMFSIETLLGPAIWALGKCFVGGLGGGNRLAKTKIGERKNWVLSVVLEPVGGNGGVGEGVVR